VGRIVRGPLLSGLSPEARAVYVSIVRTPPPDETITPALAAPGAGTRLLERARRVPPRMLACTLFGFGVYLVTMRFTGGGNRPEQFLGFGAALLLVLWSDATRRFFTGMLPFLLFAIVTDLSRLTAPLFQVLPIHVEEPYRLDQLVFGVRTAGRVLTPPELFAIHHWPAVDLVAGTAYIIFVWWALGFAAYLALFRRDAAGRRLLVRFGWTFLAMNVAGIVTYYLYPAAPPWYVAEYGLGPVHREARASMAGAARWDALTGIPWFTSFYSRSPEVFGAIPSLHVSYPLLTYLFGRELGKRWLDAASFGLFLLVAFAAVYLGHHYVIDVVLGALYAIGAWAIGRERPGHDLPAR
jgi:membrane-associated phospholipid phosphatase